MKKAEFLSGLADLPLVREVSCDNCGSCCMHMGFPPFIGMYDYKKGSGDPEWLALPEELANEARQGAVDNRGTQKLPCIWLDTETKRCRHYEYRPQICRDFQAGSEDCIEHREKRGIR